jgi:hypothetical protein
LFPIRQSLPRFLFEIVLIINAHQLAPKIHPSYNHEVLPMLLHKSFTRLTIAVSIAALFCAALCPMTCALSFCPGQSHDSPAQDCDHSSGAGSASHHHGPAGPGCTTHHDLAGNLVKPSSLIQFHSAFSSQAPSPDFLRVSARTGFINRSSLAEFGLATLPDFTLSVSSSFSVLRI